jgi:hypothetical protein
MDIAKTEEDYVTFLLGGPGLSPELQKELDEFDKQMEVNK